LKIAVVSPYSWAHPGGVNNHVEGLSTELARRGHEVTIVAPDGGVEVPGTAFIKAGRSVPVPANGSIARLALLPATRSLVRKALREGDFDVVHVHEPLVPMVSTSAVMGAPGRVVGTFHAAGEGRSVSYALAKVLMGRVHSRLAALIAVSEPARSLASRYFPGEYRVIPNGVDLGRFAPGGGRPSGFPPGDGPVVLFVGRNEPRKGMDVLLEAFNALSASVPGCRLVVVGSGFEEGKVRHSVAAGLRERVTVVGQIGNEELPAYYSAADVFCAPALGGESFGVVLIESIASGTPVVASDIPGYSGVLEKSGGGLLFKTGDPDSLAKALTALLVDDDRRRGLAEEGLERVKEFSWERLAERLEQVYRLPPASPQRRLVQ
jgi:phosphatidyl-myo-inositol alpha-mannosyltransferase